MSEYFQQHFYHPRATGENIAERFERAKIRLSAMLDDETKAIFAPLIAGHSLIVDPIITRAETLKKLAKHLIVIGSGGSGLSGKALVSTYTDPSPYQLHVLDSCDLFFAEQLMRTLQPENTALLIISKSGTTVETLAYADIFTRWLATTPNASERITVITMTDNNLLHQHAVANDWDVIAHDPQLCGRFSMLSAVGLLPAAFVGMDIAAILRGAASAWNAPAAAFEAAVFQYQAAQYGLGVHITFAYGHRFAHLISWWRQSMAESLGKQGKGFHAICAHGTRDQHSQLQMYLDGNPIAIYTIMTEQSVGLGTGVSKHALLPMLQEKTLGDVIHSQQMATLGTLRNAGKSIRHLHLLNHNEATIGSLIVQWAQEIIVLGFMMNVNPFDQPAIEESKRLARDFLIA